MPRIATTVIPSTGLSGQIGGEGKLFYFAPKETSYVAADFVEILLPAGTQGLFHRPSWADYNSIGNSWFLGTGAWTANIQLDRNLRALRQGLPAPSEIPQVALAGGGSIDGANVCYHRFMDILSNRVGPLSGPAPSLAAGGSNTIDWTQIPTESVDPSVTHIQGLRDVDGAGPRVAWTRQLGATSVSEGLAAGDLGELAPPTFEAFPLCTASVMYNNAQWGFGNERFPERVFRSELGFPERWSGKFVQTDGEAVVGIFEANGKLLFGSKKRIYFASGFTDADMVRDVEKPDFGLVGHHAQAHVHGRVIVPTNVNIFLYDGTWHPLLDSMESEWQNEYEANRDSFEAAMGHFNPRTNIYTFGPVRHSLYPNLWVDWVLDTERVFPETEAGPFTTAWEFDGRTRKLVGRATYYLPSSQQPLLVSGAVDGHIRYEDEASNRNDDGDTYAKQVTIEPAPISPDPGGFPSDGFRFMRAWNHILAESTGHTVEFRAGGEHAWQRLNPDFTESIGSLNESDTGPGGETRTAERLSEVPYLLHGVVGTMIFMRLTFTQPQEVEWRGWGVTYGPGHKTRGIVTEEFPV